MKKIVYILSTALLALAACNKEADSQKQNDIAPGATKTGYVLHASISDLATKAEIAEATGAVTFNENDSFIIQGDDNNWYTFTTSQSGASVDFVCPDAPSTVSFVGKEANYPADKFSTTSNSFNMPTEYASPKDALKNGIFMSGKVSSEGTLLFSHTLAGMLKVTFNNVPEFADNVYFEKGTAPLLKTEVSLAGESGDNVVVYCPIYYQAGNLTVSLRDADDNVILQKSTTVPSGQQGKLYALKPLTVGWIMTFNGAESDEHWTQLKLHVWNAAEGSTQNFDIKSEALDAGIAYPWKLNKLSNSYYAVLSSELGDWITEGTGVGLKLEGLESWSVETDHFYLYRNGTFTIAAGQGLKTDYRLYAKIAKGKRIYWGTGGIKISENYQNKFDSEDMVWVYGSTTATSESDSEESLYYYDISNGGEWFYWDNLNFHIWNPNNLEWKADWKFPNDGSYRLTRDCMYTFI